MARITALRAALIGLAVGLGVLAAPSLAWSKPAPEGFEDLSERLMPAVVNIATTQRIVGGPDAGFPSGSPFERFNEMLGDSGRQVSSLGSGFILSADGVVVTNNHVIDEADEITVILQTGDQLKAQLVGRDPATDLAVLRVRPLTPLPYVAWGDSSQVRVGQWVIAIGNPFGLGGSVSAGIISARNRNIDAGRYDDFLQTDAAINRGNSGGPLFDMSGRVIGVNTAIVSPSGGSVGVGFATPSELARSVVDQLLKYGETRRGWLGVRIAPVSPELAARNGLNRPQGALVAAVTEGGPAAKSGLKTGDVILAFDGKAVAESRILTRFVAESAIDRIVTVEFLRGGKRMSTTVKVGRLDEQRVAVLGAPQPETASPQGASPYYDLPSGVQGRVLGMTLEELSRDVRARFALAPDIKGLVVVGVDAGSDAAKKVQIGDVVVEMAFEPVETIGQARALAARAERAGGRPMLLNINRAGAMTFRSVKGRT